MLEVEHVYFAGLERERKVKSTELRDSIKSMYSLYAVYVYMLRHQCKDR